MCFPGSLAFGLSLTSRLLMLMLMFKDYRSLTFVTISWHPPQPPWWEQRQRGKGRRKHSKFKYSPLGKRKLQPTWVSMSIIVIHILAMGLGDTGGPMTERIPKQEMKHPLSPWTKDVRILPVLSGLRIAHKMFYSQHPVLKKYTHPKPSPRQRSPCWICVTHSFNSWQQTPPVACYVPNLGTSAR